MSVHRIQPKVLALRDRSLHSSRGTKTLRWLVLLALFAAPRVSAKRSDPRLEKARELVTRGAYESAETQLKQLGPYARVELARLYLASGRYREASKLARAAATGPRWTEAMVVAAEAERAWGKRKEALRLLALVLRKRPYHLRARILAGLSYQESGQQALAKSFFDGFYDDYGADKIDKRSAEALTYVAIACRHSDNYRDAHDTLRDALRIDPHYVEALLELGEISLEKYEAGPAEAHFRQVLKRNPRQLRALIGLARTTTVQTGRLEPLMALLKRIRAVDPQNPAALALEATARIDNDDLRGAEAMLKAGLASAPEELELLSLLAALHFLRDEQGDYRRIKGRVLAQNSRYSRFFRIIIERAVRKHRYAQAVALGRAAVAVDPTDWYAHAEIGINQLRLGQEKAGLAALKRAWTGDNFNVRVFNLLNFFEQVFAVEYQQRSSKNFLLRAHKDEIALLARTVLPLLEEGYALYHRKYGFAPPGKITVEIFQKPEHFALRTFGLPPDTGVIGGVCFGRVITALSPNLRRFNWGQVFWHELNHSFTVELSRHRVPRWLTEGLAVMEPPLRRAEWRRKNDREIYRALAARRLPTLGTINQVFTRRGLQDVLLVYYQGGLYASYFARHWGMGAIRRLLRGYAAGGESATLLPRVFGMALPELDAGFQREQSQRLAVYSKGWSLDPQSVAEPAALAQQLKAKPQDPELQLSLALARWLRGDHKGARALLAGVKARRPKSKRVLFLASQLVKGPQREQLLVELQVAGGDGYEVRLALARLSAARNDLPRTIAHLKAAAAFDPEATAPWQTLAKIYQEKKDATGELGASKRLAELNQQSFATAWRVTEALAKRGDWAGVRRYGTMAYYVAPGVAALHEALAKAYEQPAPRPQLAKACWHLETALLCAPKEPKRLHLELARLYTLRGQTAVAAKHRGLGQ